MLAYARALNSVSESAFNNQWWTSLQTHHRMYQAVRTEFGLRSQMACNVFRQVAASYHGATEAEKAKRRKSLHRFRANSMILQHGQEWGFKKNDHVSISTLNGRTVVPFKVGEHQRQYMDGTWTYGAATLVRRKSGNCFLHISVEKEVAEQTEKANILGVDVGMNYLAVGCTLDNKSVFFGGNRVKNQHRQRRRKIKQLKSKGTSSARRRLRSFAGKQKRFQLDVNHQVSRKLVNFAVKQGVGLIAVEDLTNIHKLRRRGAVERAEFSNWSNYQLRQFLTYKAENLGIRVTEVDPAYTSQACSHCGHTCRQNRNRHEFRCLMCGNSLHADLNASRNIAHRARAGRQCCPARGPVSDPDAPTVDPGRYRRGQRASLAR